VETGPSEIQVVRALARPGGRIAAEHLPELRRISEEISRDAREAVVLRAPGSPAEGG